MLTLNDGRNELWQWDTNRKLTVDADCSQVHFSNKVFGRSIDVDVADGVATIPDVLLQGEKDIYAWAFVGTAENGYTKISKTFKVNRRNKPADYVFTPPEQTTLDELVERLEKIEESQDPDAIKNAVEDYLQNNPIQIDEKDPTVPEWAKQPTKPSYTAEEVGALSADTLPTAVNNALAQAKASGEFDGKDGSNGTNGKDGASVTVKSVSESTADGGSNVVTFSDGKTVTIKNGSKGSPGATPVRGTDYWTETDKQEILSELRAEQTGMLEIPLTELGYMEGGNGWNQLNTTKANARNSGYVEIPEGYSHIKANLSINKYGWAVLFATGNGTGLILDSTISALGGETVAHTKYFVEIPANAKYVMVSTYTNADIACAYFVNEDDMPEEETPTDILDGTEFALFKQWGIVGDSLSVGHTADSDGNASSPNLYYSWGQYLARRIGNTCLNIGRSGVSAKAWMTDAKGYNLLIQPEQLCQCYILALGANDSDYTLGSIADVDFSNMNNNADTEYGWYAKVINAIRTTAPQAPIFLFTLPYPRNTDTNIQAINGMIRELASNENFSMVYLVDLDADYNDYFKEGKLGNCIGNTGWHLTALGYLYASVVNEVAISKVMAEHPGDFQNVFEIPYGKTEVNTPTDGEDGVGIASIEQTTTSTADGGNNILTITLTNGESTTFTVKNGSKGSKGDTGATGPAYTLTSTDKSAIASEVKASLTTETWTFELADGSTVTKAVLLG